MSPKQQEQYEITVDSINATSTKQEFFHRKPDWTIVRSDVDTVFLKTPLPYIHTTLFESIDSTDFCLTMRGQNEQLVDGSKSNSSFPYIDIVALFDACNASGVDVYYCSGFFVISPTPASI